MCLLYSYADVCTLLGKFLVNFPKIFKFYFDIIMKCGFTRRIQNALWFKRKRNVIYTRIIFNGKRNEKNM